VFRSAKLHGTERREKDHEETRFDALHAERMCVYRNLSLQCTHSTGKELNVIEHAEMISTQKHKKSQNCSTETTASLEPLHVSNNKYEETS